MKRLSLILILILFIVVGYATIHTELAIKSNINVSENQDDFNLELTNLKTGSKIESKQISTDRQSFSFKATESDILKYTVTNNSYQYDVEVNLICAPNDNISIEQIGKIPAQGRATKTISVNNLSEGELESFTCRIEPTKISRTNYADDNIVVKWFKMASIEKKNTYEVFSDRELTNKLMQNQSAMEFLLANEELIEIVKNDEHYSDTIVPAMLDEASKDNNLNQRFHLKRLPCYIYNYGEYYLINEPIYVPPVFSQYQLGSISNSTEGLSLTTTGKNSGSASTCIYYSDKGINLNNYSKLGYATNQYVEIDFNTSTIGLFNGTITQTNWESNVTNILTSTTIKNGETVGTIEIPDVDGKYQLFINHLVNKYQLAGNYTNLTIIRSLWLE